MKMMATIPYPILPCPTLGHLDPVSSSLLLFSEGTCLHSNFALLADVAKQAPARAAAAVERQPAGARHRDVCAVRAQRRMRQRPVCGRIRRLPQSSPGVSPVQGSGQRIFLMYTQVCMQHCLACSAAVARSLNRLMQRRGSIPRATGCLRKTLSVTAALTACGGHKIGPGNAIVPLPTGIAYRRMRQRLLEAAFAASRTRSLTHSNL